MGMHMVNSLITENKQHILKKADNSEEPALVLVLIVTTLSI